MKIRTPFDDTLESKLNTLVFDRTQSCALLASLWRQHRLQSEGGSPFFAVLYGPANAGKKHLAVVFANLLGRSVATLDLQRFSEGADLIGEEGALVALFKTNPGTAVVFEGIDKAPETVQMALLALVEEPSFAPLIEKSLLFVTTQAGEALCRDGDFLERFYKQPLYEQGVFMEHLASTGAHIHPALLSFLALRPAVLLSPMKLETLFKIARQSLEGLRAPLQKNAGITLSFDRPLETAALMTLSLAPWLNARRIKKQLPGHFLDKLTEILKPLKPVPATVSIAVAADALTFFRQAQAQPDTWAWRLTRGNETVNLEWAFLQEGPRLTLTLAKAEVAARPLPPVFEGALRVFHPKAGFDTIPGQKNAKRALGEILALLKEPQRLARFGSEPPKGMLLFGPEGVGKAALAKAFAAEAGWPCLEASGASLFDEAFLERLYEKAASYAPAVVLLEGLDAKGVVQGMVTTVPSEWLIRRLDLAAKGVFTLATAEAIDEVPEILRSAGRLDLSLEVPELDHEARLAFLSRLLEYPHEAGIDLGRLARITGGLNGRDLEKMTRACALEAAKQENGQLTQAILTEQINTLKYGRKLEGASLKDYERELQMTAWHEAGHAVLSSVLQPEMAIEQVTVAPRAETLGFVAYEMDEKISNLTKSRAQITLCILMAGRLAQKKAFGENALDTGAVGDLENATRLAWMAVSSLGLDEELGFLSLGALARELGYQPYAARIEERVRLWLQRAEEQARLLLDEHWDKVEKLAGRLIAEGVIEGEALAGLLGTKASSAQQNPQKTGESAARPS